MFNKSRLKAALAEYKKCFVQMQWPKEEYKWKAVKCFQENWDVDAEDFVEMLTRSLSKTENLLTSGRNFPAGMITQFAEEAPKEVRSMFIELFDEEKDVYERIEAFKKISDHLLEKYGNGAGQHFQRENAICTYLWLRYPDKYYIYKWSEVREVSDKLECEYTFKKGDYTNNIRDFHAFYDAICAELQKDEELKKMLASQITDDCYPDPELRTLTIDIGFFISRYLEKDELTLLAKNLEKLQKESGLAKIRSDAGQGNQFWKISHGNDCITEAEAATFENRKVVVVHKNTAAKGKRKISQGEDFTDTMKKGDFFYLCRGNSIRLLGQIDSDEVNENPEKQEGWCERSYTVIARSSDTSAYTGVKKWWTPNDNSTCIEVPDGEKQLFEEYILKPYFDITIEELIKNEIISDRTQEKNSVPVVKGKEPYGKEDFLQEVYMTEAKYDRLAAVLKKKKNIILQGAPGVGKTFAAKRLAYSVMGEIDDDRVEFVQFHQNYSYEDFVMGYKPAGNGFELKYGIFYRFCQKAAEHPDKDYFFIIDEINRGNLSKIFGELLMLIEADYREKNVTLAYNGLGFSVPKRLHIIGMMNTADRSLAMIDYALRRRFSFFDMEPGFDSEGFINYQNRLANDTFNTLIERIKELNKKIAQDKSLGKGFCIGHSYFCNAEECTDEWMKDVVDFDILPMLSEYWFDEDAELQRWEDILHGVFQ